MLVMGEHERRFRDGSDLGGAGGDVLQDAPALGQQREAAFARARRDRSSML
jgi:hypothetical protein